MRASYCSWAHLIVHEGAIYVHQGDSSLVETLDLDDRVALVEPCEPGYTTMARDVTEVEIRGECYVGPGRGPLW